MRVISLIALALACGNSTAEVAPPMEHMLVSVPVHKKVAETALPVTVLSGEELRRQAGTTIGDTLSNSPGLASASFGPGVGQPVIRGQAGPRVKVLQNGTSSADASNISADHAVSVEAMLADSVEVLRGPATLLYGGGAIGGVVNVIDNRIPVKLEQGLSGALEARHDTVSDGNTLVARMDGGSGQFAFHLDGLYREWDDIEIPGSAAREVGHEDEHEEEHEDEHEEEHEEESETTRGFVDNTDGRTSSITAGAAWHIDSGFLGLAVNRLENEYGIPPGAHGHGEEHHDDEHEEEHHEDEHEDEHHEDEHEGEEGHGDEVVRIDLEQTRYDAAVHLHNPFAGLDVFRGFLTYTDYEHTELEGDEVGTVYSNETWEARLEMVHTPWQSLHGSFGLQASQGEFSATGEEAFIPATDSTEIGVFLVEDYHRDRWTLEGGLRLDSVRRDPQSSALRRVDFDSVSLSGSVQYDFTDQWRTGVALMRAERAPAVEELFSNALSDDPEDWVVHAATSSIELGDPGLDTEVSNNLDVSVSWLTQRHFVSVSAFYNDFSDYIALVNTGLEVDELPVFAYRNDDAEFVGLEVDSEFTLASLGGGNLLLALTGDVIRGELDSGEDIPRLPPRRLGARLSWASDNWYAHARVLDAADQDRPGTNEEPTEGYTRWDAGLEYRLGLASEEQRLVLFLNLNNITDEEIRLSTSFLRDVAPEPGRSVQAGVRVLL